MFVLGKEGYCSSIVRGVITISLNNICCGIAILNNYLCVLNLNNNVFNVNYKRIKCHDLNTTYL